DEGTSSSLAGVASPSEQHKGAHARKGYEVQVARMSQFDTGDIDLLRVDTEGAEWLCLKHLVSRPKQIVVEMFNDLATYINPHLYEIEEWCRLNGYRRVAAQDSDFIYEQP
ncbi:MAG: FkbM family methyltransferase, partial [Candidatus Paceibacterota bacterium]